MKIKYKEHTLYRDRILEDLERLKLATYFSVELDDYSKQLAVGYGHMVKISDGHTQHWYLNAIALHNELKDKDKLDLASFLILLKDLEVGNWLRFSNFDMERYRDRRKRKYRLLGKQ